MPWAKHRRHLNLNVTALLVYLLIQLCLMFFVFFYNLFPGILILSSDITFAAKFSVEPYYIVGNKIYFTPSSSDPARIALEIGTLDKLLDVGWSFALDIAAGSICVLSSLPLMVVSVWTARTARKKPSTKAQRNRTSKNQVFARTREGSTQL